MNKIVSSKYYELRRANFFSDGINLKEVDNINTSKHKSLMKTKEIHILDNGIEITIMNNKNAVYSNDLRIKIKLDSKSGYEFILHMYNLKDSHMVKEEPIFIGDVDKHCELEAYSNNNRIGIASDALNTNIILEDVYGHKIAISGWV